MSRVLNAFTNWMVKSGQASSKCYLDKKELTTFKTCAYASSLKY